MEAFQNIPIVDIMNVERLNLLKLVPGGHLGWFVILIKLAFKKLDSIYWIVREALREGLDLRIIQLSALGTPAAKGAIDLPYGWKMSRWIGVCPACRCGGM